MVPMMVSDCLGKFLSRNEDASSPKLRKGGRNAPVFANDALLLSAAHRWCFHTYHPSHGADRLVTAACTTTSYQQGAGSRAVSLWSLFGTRKQFNTLGSPVVDATSSSPSVMTSMSLTRAVALSKQSPVEVPVQCIDANGAVTKLYCAAATAQPDRVLYLLKNRY